MYAHSDGVIVGVYKCTLLLEFDYSALNPG